MSAARRKGNALELDVARRLRAIDGRDERLTVLESAGGRLGPAYSMQVDVATQHLVVECKNREDLSLRLWDWLAQLDAAAGRLCKRLGDPARKLPLLVIKRNRREPLVVISLADFERLLRSATRFDSRIACRDDEPDLGRVDL